MDPLAIPPPMQTLFADLAQQVATAPIAGSVYRRSRDGIEYLYAKLPVGNERVDRFIGKADDAEAVARAEEMRVGAALMKQRRRIVSMLRNGGLPGPDRTLGAILDAMAHAGLFCDGAILIGTAAYLISGPVVGYRLPAPTLMTGDLDLATTSLLLGADPPERFEAILRRADPSFAGVMPLNRGALPSRFRNAQGYLVDLVTPQLRRSDTNPMPVTGLGAGATPLHHLAWLLEDPIPTIALWGGGVAVTIPQPHRFAVHKLILAQRRDPANRLKRSKDLAQAKALIDAFLRHDRFALIDALDDARARGKRGWAEPIDRSLAELGFTADL